MTAATIAVAVLFKARNLCAHSNVGIMGSNLTGVKNVLCLRAFVFALSCVSNGPVAD
jgi:hypothetical protein